MSTWDSFEKSFLVKDPLNIEVWVFKKKFVQHFCVLKKYYLSFIKWIKVIIIIKCYCSYYFNLTFVDNLVNLEFSV